MGATAREGFDNLTQATAECGYLIGGLTPAECQLGRILACACTARPADALDLPQGH